MTMFQTLRRVMHGAMTLKIVCEACGRQAAWTVAEAFARLGPDATPFEARRRLKCGGCGRKGHIRVWI